MLCRASKSFYNLCSTFIIYSIFEKNLGHEGEQLVWKFYTPEFTVCSGDIKKIIKAFKKSFYTGHFQSFFVCFFNWSFSELFFLFFLSSDVFC